MKLPAGTTAAAYPRSPHTAIGALMAGWCS